MSFNYFKQEVKVGNELIGVNRFDVFSHICKGKSVLHVGCIDYPIQNIKESLHIFLDGVCSSLDGFDIHSEVFSEFSPHLSGELFCNWSDVTASYDILLVPEVLEHVDNVKDFLEKLNGLDVKKIVLTVPDAYQCYMKHFSYNEKNQIFTEIVHPDHNSWYTPYTISNVISKYTNWEVDGIWFFNKISLLIIATPRDN